MVVIRRSDIPITGNQRSRPQQETDRTVWECWLSTQQALTNPDTASDDPPTFETEPMAERSTNSGEQNCEDYIKSLESAANYFRKTRGTNFRIKSEARDIPDDTYVDDDGNEVEFPEDFAIVAFSVVPRKERVSMRGPRGPRSKTRKGQNDTTDAA